MKVDQYFFRDIMKPYCHLQSTDDSLLLIISEQQQFKYHKSYNDFPLNYRQMSINIYVNDKANNLQFNLIFKFKKLVSI